MALLCCFLAVGFTVYPQSANYVTPLPSISEKVLSLKTNFATLERLWQEQKIAFSEAVRISNELKAELTAAQNSLADSLTSLDLSVQEVQRLTILLEQSAETLTRLQAAFDDYQETARRQIRNRNIEIWIYRVIIAILTVYTVTKNL